MKQLEVRIMGQSYLLGCPPDGDAKLLAAVEKVDAAMCKIRDAGKIKARERIAILAALNLAFEVSAQPNAAAPAALVAAGQAPTQQQLANLLERLDQTLEVDGRLI